MSSDDIDDKTALEALISSAEANEKSKLPPSKRGVNGSRWDRGSSYEPNNRNYNNRNHHQGNYNNHSRDHNYRGSENNGYRNRDRDNYGRNYRGNDLYENNSRKRVVTDSEYSDSNKSNRNKRRWGEDSRYRNKEDDPHNGEGAISSREAPPEKEKADFGLSGALAEDEITGNVYNGVVLKFREPAEARAPMTKWRLYVFKKDLNNQKTGDDDALQQILHISKQSAYLFGRDKRIADILVEHPSLSKQHCVLQYRAVQDKAAGGELRCKPYLMDLGSTNGTFINGQKLEEARYYELRRKDVITIGMSTREYVLLTENTK